MSVGATKASRKHTYFITIDPETAISLVSDQFIVTESEDIVDAPGKHEFVFKATEAGNTLLKFEYYQPWEPENIEETYLFNFTVR